MFPDSGVVFIKTHGCFVSKIDIAFNVSAWGYLASLVKLILIYDIIQTLPTSQHREYQIRLSELAGTLVHHRN